MHVAAVCMKWLVIGLYAMGIVAVHESVGKPREPQTRAGATRVAVVGCAVIGIMIVFWGT
jgi:hypothetical protein